MALQHAWILVKAVCYINLRVHSSSVSLSISKTLWSLRAAEPYKLYAFDYFPGQYGKRCVPIWRYNCVPRVALVMKHGPIKIENAEAVGAKLFLLALSGSKLEIQ